MHTSRAWGLIVGLFSVMFSLCVSACRLDDSGLSGDDGMFEEQEDVLAVSGGTASTAQSAAGFVYFQAAVNYWYFCSATLVGYRWVLTSAHCPDDPMFDLNKPNVNAVFGIGPDWQNPQQTIPIVAYNIHPEWVPNTGLVETYQSDVALLELERAPTGVTPIPVDTTPLSTADEGTTLVGYTYGAHNLFYSSTPTTWDDFGKKQEGLYLIDEVRPDGLEFATMEWQRGGNDAFCTGDSGGALLHMKDGVTSVVATMSIIDGVSCRIGTDYATLTAPHACWLEEVSGGEVWFTQPPTCD